MGEDFTNAIKQNPDAAFNAWESDVRRKWNTLQGAERTEQVGELAATFARIVIRKAELTAAIIIPESERMSMAGIFGVILGTADVTDDSPDEVLKQAKQVYENATKFRQSR